jgi:hypothetical protein
MSKRRAALVWTLVGLATLVTLIASMTIWTKRQLLDTNNWTHTSSQLLADDAVRATLSTKLIDLLYQRVDVAQVLRTQLPDNAQGAAPVIAAALQSAAVRVTDSFLASAPAQTLWERANRRMHSNLVKVLEGKDVRRLSTSGGEVVLDLRPMLQRIATRLGVEDQLKARTSPTTGEIVILKANQLEAGQKAVRVFRVLSVFIAIAVLVLYGLAIWLARPRRRVVLEVVGGTLVFVGLVLLVVRRLVGNAIVDATVNIDANRPAANHIWLIGTDLLRDIAVALLVYGILAVLAGFLGGPTRVAVAIRRFLAPTFSKRPLIVWGVAVLLFLIVLAWAPTGATRQLVGILVLAAVFALGIEAWRRQILREFPAAAPPPVEQPPEATLGDARLGV